MDVMDGHMEDAGVLPMSPIRPGLASRSAGGGAADAWPGEEEEALKNAVIQHGEGQWNRIAATLSQYGRSDTECRRFWLANYKIVKGAWTEEEDALLREVVSRASIKRWSKIAEHIPRRNAKQCRERWVNNLDDSVNKGSWTEEEDRLLVETQKRIGNKWSEIAKLLPGRPDNAVKNRWYSMMNRQANKAAGVGSAKPSKPKSSKATKSKSGKKSEKKAEKKSSKAATPGSSKQAATTPTPRIAKSGTPKSAARSSRSPAGGGSTSEDDDAMDENFELGAPATPMRSKTGSSSTRSASARKYTPSTLFIRTPASSPGTQHATYSPVVSDRKLMPAQADASMSPFGSRLPASSPEGGEHASGRSSSRREGSPLVPPRMQVMAIESQVHPAAPEFGEHAAGGYADDHHHAPATFFGEMDAAMDELMGPPAIMRSTQPTASHTTLIGDADMDGDMLDPLTDDEGLDEEDRYDASLMSNPIDDSLELEKVMNTVAGTGGGDPFSPPPHQSPTFYNELMYAIHGATPSASPRHSAADDSMVSPRISCGAQAGERAGTLHSGFGGFDHRPEGLHLSFAGPVGFNASTAAHTTVVTPIVGAGHSNPTFGFPSFA